jgi:spore maturation protein A
MNYIFYFLIVISIVIGAVNGRLQDVVNSIMTGAELSVKVTISLIGIMAFWLGIMEIAKKSGVIDFIAKIIKPITKHLFNEIPEDSPAIGDIAMNFTANAFGLANAATPFGIKAMEELQKENNNKDTASNSMCLFLGMNTAGFQLVPTTVLAILIGIGYKNPTEIIAPTLLVTTIAFVSAIILSKIFQGVNNKHVIASSEAAWQSNTGNKILNQVQNDNIIKEVQDDKNS